MRRPSTETAFNVGFLETMPSELDSIKALLLHEWDPIGVSDCEGAEDEYDRYALQVVKMLGEGADEAAIATYLDWVVKVRMSLRTNLKVSRATAAKAVAIHKLGHG
jgi:hypothetical protein